MTCCLIIQINKSWKILQWRFQEKRSKKEVVPPCNKYDIIISWIGYDMQQIMKDLALEVQIESMSTLLLVTSFFTLFWVIYASSQFVLLYGLVAQVFYIYDMIVSKVRKWKL